MTLGEPVVSSVEEAGRDPGTIGIQLTRPGRQEKRF